jgi:hypothetical protein
MTEPDDLYTLRAQYWLGHYNLAIEEAKSIARRPMSPALKAEREEILNRAYLALGQYDKLSGGTSGKSFLFYICVLIIFLFPMFLIFPCNRLSSLLWQHSTH